MQLRWKPVLFLRLRWIFLRSQRLKTALQRLFYSSVTLEITLGYLALPVEQPDYVLTRSVTRSVAICGCAFARLGVWLDKCVVEAGERFSEISSRVVFASPR